LTRTRLHLCQGRAQPQGGGTCQEKKHLAPVPENLINVKRVFASSLDREGIQDFRFHELLHTFASHMVMKGASLKEVQEILGHKTMTMSLRYAHLDQEHKKKAVNLLNGLTAIGAVADASCHKMSQIPNQSVSALR
jgi:integrase